MTDPALFTMTEEEYLASEERFEVRREYVDGFVYARAGASKRHGRIAGNILRVLLNAVQGGPCWVYASDTDSEKFVRISRTLSSTRRGQAR